MKRKILILILNFSFFILNNSFAQTISGGAYHSLASCSDSTVRTWGFNINGQLGNGTNTDSNVPVQVSTLPGITAIAGGYHHSLALKNDGTVRAWGLNSLGQLGNGTYTDSNVPVPVNALSGITAIAGGGYHSLALKNDGTVRA
ncbi:MAG: RCC1 repeat- and reductase domain-containing protein, partial [Bacteroidia bacterium]|nr:RCC1 repeat- and reductase domain-containing protein [Bacteroidia bacterium]